MNHLQYPIGKFKYNIDNKNYQEWIATINGFPTAVESHSFRMTEQQLNLPYRPEGWTAKQLIHHLADSHSHALLRFKSALTEHKPTIKPYLEAEYALLPDYNLPIDSALMILKGVHLKWVNLLENMAEDDYSKGYFHPESGHFFTIHNALALYDWHCKHHLGHLEICSNKK
ncbi:MAG: putative metal-dependent hydrolase [Saprospiraceae bacterium]|nr:putative metal-dependent hydrolase [Saprospiraceae bacterium]